MPTRFLAGLAASLGFAGSLVAQQPAATFGRPQAVTARGQMAAPAATASRSPAATLGRVSDAPRSVVAAPLAPAAPAYAPPAAMLYGDGCTTGACPPGCSETWLTRPTCQSWAMILPPSSCTASVTAFQPASWSWLYMPGVQT